MYFLPTLYEYCVFGHTSFVTYCFSSTIGKYEISDAAQNWLSFHENMWQVGGKKKFCVPGSISAFLKAPSTIREWICSFFQPACCFSLIGLKNCVHFCAEHYKWYEQTSRHKWTIVMVDCCTSAASNRMSTFLLFLALTFWLRNLSSSGTQFWLRERGRPMDGDN